MDVTVRAVAPATIRMRFVAGLLGPRGLPGDVTPAYIALSGQIATDAASVAAKAAQIETARQEVDADRNAADAAAAFAQNAASTAASSAVTSVTASLDSKVTAAAGSASAAATSAGAAATSATAAAGSASSALVIAGQSRLAADTLAALALLAPPDGSQAEVTADGANNGTYRREGGAWVRKSTVTLPVLDTRLTAAESNIVSTEEGPKVAGGFLDATRRFLAYIHFSARFEFLRGMLHTAQWNEDLDFTPLWDDPSGRVIVGLNRDGKLRLRLDKDSARRVMDQVAMLPEDLPSTLGLSDTYGAMAISPTLGRTFGRVGTRSGAYLFRRDTTPSVLIEEVRGRIQGLIHTGQSNSMGGGANDMPAGQEVITTTPPVPANGLMFTTGTRGNGDVPLDPATLTDFAPAKEVYTNLLGESQGSGMMNWLCRQIDANGEPHQVYVYRSHGKGGYSITALKKGTVPYANGMIEIAAMKRIAADPYRRGFYVPGVSWTQGEQDTTDNMPRDTYLGHLLQLAADYRADIPAITGQTETVLFFVDQVSSPTNSNATDVSEAQLRACEQDPNIIFVGPNYHFTGSYGIIGTVHRTPTGHARLGEYHAKARRAGASWKGCRPSSIVRTGPQIDITYFVPVAPLVFDTTLLPAAPNMGFVWTPSTGTGTITNVQIVGANVVRITLSEGVPGTLSYAMVGTANQTGRSRAWGNVRDSDPAPSYIVPAVPLYNWAAMMNKDVA